MFLKSTRRRGQGGVLPRSWMLPLAAATVALGTSTAHAQVSAYNALPPVKLTTVSHPLVLVTPTDSANALLADAAYEPITGGTLLVDGSQAATESNSVFGTGYTTYDQAPGFFGPGSWRPAAWTGVAAFVGNGAEIGFNNQTRNGPGLSIGFPFTFNAEVFDRIGISSQGWISFGKSTDGATAVRVHTSTAPATLNSPLANTAVINNDYRRNRVVAYGVQGGTWSGGSALVPYVFQSGYSGYPGSTLRMETIGTAPNRICVVQWDNFVIWPQGTLSAPDPSFFRFMNFQIRLHENGNKVEVRYGDCRRGPGVTSFNQIGLGGAAATDFNGWQRAAGWPTSWSGANYDTRVALPDPHEFTAMTANTQQISGSASGTPDMLSFMFTPPACPQQATAVNITNITPGSATLNWSGTGTFDYAVGTTNNPAAATITGTVTGNSVNLPSLTSGTTYYAFVRTNCSPDFSVWSSSVSFATFFTLNCGTTWTAGGPTDPNLSSSGRIFKNTYVICPSTPGHQATIDFATWSAPMWTNQQFNAIFVHNGDSPSAPLIPGPGTGASCTGNACSPAAVGTWTVPAGGFMNDTRPPITTSTAPNGCLTIVWYSSGYDGWSNGGWSANITCAAPPTCFPPTNRVVVSTTPDAATFSWTSSSPSDDFIVVANGGTPASPVLASGSSSTGTGSVSGLNPNTQYTAFFRGSCDGGADLSAWSDPGLNFRTRVGCGGNFLMGDYAASVAVPLDSVVVICPDNVGDVVTVDFTDFYPGDRDLHMFVYDGPTTASYFLNSGQTTSPPGFPVGGYRLSGIANLPDVFTSTHSSGCLTFRFGATQPRFNFPPVNIAANVTCAPPPPCATPGAVTVSDIGGTSATVSWTGAGSDYIVEFGPTGFTPGTGATAGVNGTVITNATSGTVLSLTVTTGYDVYVRQVCAGPTYSSNSFRSRFTTSIDCAQAIALDCGSFVTQPLVYETFGSSIYQGANYTQAACIASAGGGTGAERLYRITAPVAGTYQLDITGVPTVSTVSFLIAPATAGCGAGAFTCITNTVNSPTWPNAPMPSQHSLTLAAGDYYILVDPNAYAEGNITFRVNCPGIPACVVAPTYPPNNATVASTTNAFNYTWPAAFGATQYEVYFNNSLVATVNTNSVPSGSYNTAAVGALVGLGNDALWRVQPKNVYGTASCPNWSFVVGANGIGNALTLTEGVVRNGNRFTSNGYTNLHTAARVLKSGTNDQSYTFAGADAWFTFVASECADSVRVNLKNVSPTGKPMGLVLLDENQNGVVLPNIHDNSNITTHNGVGIYASLATGASFTHQVFDWDLYMSTSEQVIHSYVPTWKVTPGQRYYIVVDGYNFVEQEGAFEVSFSEVTNSGDYDGDGIPDCVDSCVEIPGEMGDPCYAGPLFASGIINENCECEGQDPQPCNNDLTLEFQTDDAPWDITWELVEQGTNFVVQQGGPLNPQNSVETNFTCLPDGCFYLRVLDAAGDGMTTGGYILRNSGDNSRIIDNRNNFSTGEVSQIAGGQGFCLPIGDDKLIYSSCDKLDWVANKFIVASANPAVSAQFGVANSTSGYEFWFYDPNGSFSYRRFRSHATSDGFGTGATRACHFKVNGWFQNANNPHLPANVLLNVRIRGRVAGNNLEFGPACQFKIDPTLAACPRVSLQDNPANTSDYSCGVFRNFGGAGNAANRIYANPPQPIPTVSSANVRYQFRFRIPGENICIVRPPQTSAQMTLSWTNGTPLECSKTYEVDVRVSLNGGATWCFGPATSDAAAACADTEAWGKVCNVTINPCAQVNGGGNSMVVNGANTFTMYPNPNRGEQLFLSVSTVEAGVNTVNVDIFDMTGKRVVARTIAVQDGFVNTNLELSSELAAGIYMVNVTAGNKSYTERLVIQR